jgi:hypothetical protein
MATTADYGQPGDTLDSPSLSEWAGAVHTTVTQKEPAGTAAAAVTAHANAADPHPQYVTANEHEGAPDPHPQYLTYNDHYAIDHAPQTTAKVDKAGTATALWAGTQAQYDAIGSKSATTVYVIT